MSCVILVNDGCFLSTILRQRCNLFIFFFAGLTRLWERPPYSRCLDCCWKALRCRKHLSGRSDARIVELDRIPVLWRVITLDRNLSYGRELYLPKSGSVVQKEGLMFSASTADAWATLNGMYSNGVHLCVLWLVSVWAVVWIKTLGPILCFLSLRVRNYDERADDGTSTLSGQMRLDTHSDIMNQLIEWQRACLRIPVLCMCSFVSWALSWGVLLPPQPSTATL